MNHMIKVLPDGRHQVYRVLMGHYTLAVGKPFDEPRRAVDYAKSLDTAYVSPFRNSAEPSTPSSSAPPQAALALDGSAESPRGRLRASRTARG